MTYLPRKPTEADKPAIRQIVEANAMFPVDMLDGMMRPYFDGDQDQRWFVIGTPAIAVAYATPERMTSGTWNQWLLAVDPDYQRRGLGLSLMRNLETTVKQQGARMVIVETSSLAGFETARCFYKSIGYFEEARIHDFYDKGDDKIIFKRILIEL